MNTRPYDVLVVGELNVDLIVSGDVTPEFGQTEKLVDDISVCAGSSSAIFAAAAAKLGLRVLFSGRVGDDLFGGFMLQALADAGIETDHIMRDPDLRTGACVVLSRGASGDRAMLTYLGSIAAVDERDVSPDHFYLARHLHVASPYLLRGLRPYMPEMMRLARSAGMTVSLDTNWDPAQQWVTDDLLQDLDVFLPNEQELCAIAGIADVEQALQAMAARVPLVVVKRGGRGATALRGDERVDVPAGDVEVVDTTGAGDVFGAGFLAGWLNGLSLRSCALLASACGSLSTRTPGGFRGQPTWEEAAEFLRGSVGEELA